jgi:hypothetical protein
MPHNLDDLGPCAVRIFIGSGGAHDREHWEHLCRGSAHSGSAFGIGVATERWRRVAAGRIRHCAPKEYLKLLLVRWCLNNTIALKAESNTADNLCKALNPRPGVPYAGPVSY